MDRKVLINFLQRYSDRDNTSAELAICQFISMYGHDFSVDDTIEIDNRVKYLIHEKYRKYAQAIRTIPHYAHYLKNYLRGVTYKDQEPREYDAIQEKNADSIIEICRDANLSEYDR